MVAAFSLAYYSLMFLAGTLSLWLALQLFTKKASWQQIILAELITFTLTLVLASLAPTLLPHLRSTLILNALLFPISLFMHMLTLTILFRLAAKQTIRISLLWMLFSALASLAIQLLMILTVSLGNILAGTA